MKVVYKTTNLINGKIYVGKQEKYKKKELAWYKRPRIINWLAFLLSLFVFGYALSKILEHYGFN